MTKKLLAFGIAAIMIVIVLIAVAKGAETRSDETIARIDAKIEAYERGR